MPQLGNNDACNNQEDALHDSADGVFTVEKLNELKKGSKHPRKDAYVYHLLVKWQGYS